MESTDIAYFVWAEVLESHKLLLDKLKTFVSEKLSSFQRDIKSKSPELNKKSPNSTKEIGHFPLVDDQHIFPYGQTQGQTHGQTHGQVQTSGI